MRFRLGRLQRNHTSTRVNRQRYDVSPFSDVLHTDAEGKRRLVVDEYQDKVTAAVADPSADPTSPEERWSVLCSAMQDAAESTLGYQKRRQPDWFTENRVTLEPLLDARNTCYRVWCQSSTVEDHRRYKMARSAARAAVRCAKKTHGLLHWPQASKTPVSTRLVSGRVSRLCKWLVVG